MDLPHRTELDEKEETAEEEDREVEPIYGREGSRSVSSAVCRMRDVAVIPGSDGFGRRRNDP
jgi:hypothetical protein